jgi:hypothetical protein
MVDVGLALGYFVLTAHEFELGTCPIGLIAAYEDEIKDLLNIPENKNVVVSTELLKEDIEKELLSMLGDQLPSDLPEYKDNPDKTVDSETSSHPFGSSKASKDTPHLEKFCVDLIAQARNGKMDPCIGRIEERKRIWQVFLLSAFLPIRKTWRAIRLFSRNSLKKLPRCFRLKHKQQPELNQPTRLLL